MYGVVQVWCKEGILGHDFILSLQSLGAPALGCGQPCSVIHASCSIACGWEIVSHQNENWKATENKLTFHFYIILVDVCVGVIVFPEWKWFCVYSCDAISKDLCRLNLQDFRQQ